MTEQNDNKERKIHYIDVGDMSLKEAQKVYDDFLVKQGGKPVDRTAEKLIFPMIVTILILNFMLNVAEIYI